MITINPDRPLEDDGLDMRLPAQRGLPPGGVLRHKEPSTPERAMHLVLAQTVLDFFVRTVEEDVRPEWEPR